jgi:two-component sensor histidine kinase
MDHRVKNLFALAISVLRLSGRSAGSVPELIESTSHRLSALARAHALTLSSGLRDLPHAAKPATLYSLIQAITAPHDIPGDLDASKFSVIGCDMEISGSVISSLALLLNEFATNATKYGALSATAGRIRIQCTNHFIARSHLSERGIDFSRVIMLASIFWVIIERQYSFLCSGFSRVSNCQRTR